MAQPRAQKDAPRRRAKVVGGERGRERHEEGRPQLAAESLDQLRARRGGEREREQQEEGEVPRVVAPFLRSRALAEARVAALGPRGETRRERERGSDSERRRLAPCHDLANGGDRHPNGAVRERDRREGEGRLAEMRFRLIDTAGLEKAKAGTLEDRMRLQTEAAVVDAVSRCGHYD